MKTQACEPCSKRKVRCDRQEPCSNCKRRKTDHCAYPESSPFERIRNLEALVRSLGGNPNGQVQTVNPVNEATTPEQSKTHAYQARSRASEVQWKSNDPVISEEDGSPVYLESRAWHDWRGNSHSNNENQMNPQENAFNMPKHPDALQGMLHSNNSIDLASRHPPSKIATILWATFKERIDPLVRISFSWTLKSLKDATTDRTKLKDMSISDHSLVFSMYLITVISLSDDNCRAKLHQSRSFLISELQMLCEEAFSRHNILCVNSVTVLKALVFYLMAGIDRLSTQSLWSLMGLIIRNAERLGIHRDGTLLGLSPADTEERRRLWWQLQHLDLVLSVKSGLTSLTLMAAWDAKLPLNIEDDDIHTNSLEFPKEREGLTSMSYCLYTYWVLDQQRSFFHHDSGHFELSWQSNKLLPHDMKDSLLQQLEEGLNRKFLQYCDPIRPLDVLIQLSARMLVCGLRMRTLYSSIRSGDDSSIDKKQREALVSASTRSLEYSISFHSQPAIQRFLWLTKAFFSWHAFMCILVEMSHQNDEVQADQIWDLLSKLYVANSSLLQLSEDRRRYHAASLVVAAWKAHQIKFCVDEKLDKPPFVSELEAQLMEIGASSTKFQATKDPTNRSDGLSNESLFFPDHEHRFNIDVNLDFDFDFPDIDWSFWNSMD